MNRIFSRALVVTAVSLSLSACNAPNSNTVGSGKVVTLGQKKLILENEGEFLFLDVQASDHERLKDLKKGEHITLLGKTTETADNSSGSKSTSSEISEVVQDDGTHIRLGAAQ